MNNTPKSKRLAKIELQLTPKQWAIGLADEMRRYHSRVDFLKAIAKSTYRQSPMLRPFYALAEQAHERWPERTQQDSLRKIELDCKMQMEFQALKMLTNDVNSEIEIRARTNRLKAALQLSKLHALVLKDALAHTGVAETIPANSASLARQHHSSALNDWADITAMLFLEIIAYKAAVQAIQEKYFDSHPILYKDNEMAVEMTIQTFRDAIATFNEYYKVRADLSNREADQGQRKAGMPNATSFECETNLPIDIEFNKKSTEMLAASIVEKFVMNAKCKANFDISLETGKHEDAVWQQFRKEMGL
jgi:hypothetical protein